MNRHVAVLAAGVLVATLAVKQVELCGGRVVHVGDSARSALKTIEYCGALRHAEPENFSQTSNFLMEVESGDTWAVIHFAPVDGQRSGEVIRIEEFVR